MADQQDKYADVPPHLLEKVQAWVAEHGSEDVVWWNTRRGFCCFKTPQDTDYERFIDRVAKDKESKAIALRELAQNSRLYPENLDELKSIFSKLPALPAAIGGTLSDMAGADAKAGSAKS